jgi:hypothetical protein
MGLKGDDNEVGWVATVTTEHHPPINNAHRDPREVVQFFCVIRDSQGRELSTSGIWCRTAGSALQYAKENLARRSPDIVCEGFQPWEHETREDAWGQLHVRIPEEAERHKQYYTESGITR